MYMVGSDTNIGSAWPNLNCIPKYRADASIKLTIIQKPAFMHACNRSVSKGLIFLNFRQQTGKTSTSCMFHNKLLLVCPLHEHSTCHRLGWSAAVGFHTDLQLSCRMHKGMEVYVVHVPHNLLSKITTVMIWGVKVVIATWKEVICRGS